MEYLILRGLSSFIAGIVLSQSGSLIQFGTRNILSSPSTLGFDGLVILWLLILNSIFLILGLDIPLSSTLLLGVPLFVLVGVYFSRFLTKDKKFQTIILVGITFNIFVGAIFSLWQFMFMAFNFPFPIELWFGHFRYVEWNQFILLLIVEILILLGLRKFSNTMKLASISRELLIQWNLSEKSLNKFIFIAVTIATLVVIQSYGAFSFIGLVFPIIARKFWFSRFDLKGEFLVGAAVNGFIFALLDAACYFFPVMGAEIPVGLIVTVFGAASLIILLWTQGTKTRYS